MLERRGHCLRFDRLQFRQILGMSSADGTVDSKARFFVQLALITSSGLLFSCVVHFFAYPSLGYAQYPYSTFLGLEHLIFSDFYETCHRATHDDPYSIWTLYFPSALQFFSAFCRFSPKILSLDDLLAILILVNFGFFSLISARLLKVGPRSLGYWLLFYITSYPFLYAVNRGNIELLIVILVAGFVFFERTGRSTGAVALISLAASFKGIPGIFAAEYLGRRRYAAFGATLALIVVFSVLGVLQLPGDMIGHLAGLIRQHQKFDIVWAQGLDGLVRSASFYGMVKTVLLLTGAALPTANVIASILWVALLMLLGFQLWTMIQGWRPATAASRFMVMALIFLFFPRVSNDYKVMILSLFPLLFTNDEWRFFDSQANVIVFGLIFVPKNFIVLASDSLTRFDANLHATYADVTLGAIVTPLLICTLAVSFYNFGNRAAAMRRLSAHETYSGGAGGIFQSRKRS